MATPRLSSRIGTTVLTSTVAEIVRAYIPKPLPPHPPLDLARLLAPIERANQALGRLDGMTSILPSTHLFVFMYVRKEALLSSQIEGTQSSLSDLLLFESEEVPFVPLDDVQEVSNYIAAMDHGLKRLAAPGPALARPRRQQATRRVPQEPELDRRNATRQRGLRTTPSRSSHRVPRRFGRIPSRSEDLSRPHPRGVSSRTVRNDSPVSGWQWSSRAPPHQSVRTKGDWEGWVEFFLEGVAETSEQGVSTARRLLQLFEDDEGKIAPLGRAASSALRVHAELKRSPLLAVPLAAKKLAISQPTVQKSLDHLTKLGIVKEVTGKRRSRLYEYTRYLRILDEGTEPLRR